MRRCFRCDRHVFEDALHCPFCGARHRVVDVAPVLCALVGLSLVSCSDRTTDDEGADAGMTEGQGTTGPSSDSVGETGVATDTGLPMTSTTIDPATTSTGDITTDEGSTTATAGTTSETDTDTTGMATTGDDTATTAIPPYGGAFPDPKDEAEVDPDQPPG